MIANFLASRFAGPIVMALAALALAGGIFGGVQTYRLGNAQDTITTQAELIQGKDQALALATSMIATRDGLIKSQNEGIEALKKVREEERAAYLKQYAAADERAKSNDARAKQLLGLSASNTDELTQCREARGLLLQELVK
nr:hypothetical protein [uncultured Sphingomonas sp.]